MCGIAPAERQDCHRRAGSVPARKTDADGDRLIDVDMILAPISPELPAGMNLRADEAGSLAYYRIKDARSAARNAERQADAEQERGALAGEWRVVFDEAQAVLCQRSKDLEIAAWLTEAAIRIDGFAGLRPAFAALDGLVERYWETLHSGDAEDVADKVAPLAGLNGTNAEGSLIQPLRLAPLTAAHSGEAGTLWHYMVKRRKGAASREAVLLGEAVTATDSAVFIGIYRDIAAALEIFSTLSRRLDALCGHDAPPSSTIRNTLIEAQDALRDFSNLPAGAFDEPKAEEHVEYAQEDQAAGSPAVASGVAPAGPAELRTREDALRELGRIATFFREHEPNSPTAYTLQTLIRRARLPLADLLQELITDEAVRRAYLNVAGIGPEISEK